MTEIKYGTLFIFLGANAVAATIITIVFAEQGIPLAVATSIFICGIGLTGEL